MNQPTILFLFTAESYHREASPLISEFMRRGWSVKVLLGFHSSHTEKVVEACQQQGAVVELVPAEAAYVEFGYGNLAESRVASAVRFAKEVVGSSTLAIVRRLCEANRGTGFGRLFGLPGLLIQCIRRRRVAEDIVARLQPFAVIMGAYHSSGQIDNAIARACRQQSILTYCIPNSPYLGTLTLRVGRLNHLEQGMASPAICVHYDVVNRLLGWLFPAWTNELPDGRRAFYWDSVTMLAATLTGLQMDRPWLKPALGFKRVFVHSVYSRDLLLRDSYPADRIVVSGPPLLDAVLEHIGDKEHEVAMYSHIKLPLGSPFLLFNVEPSAEHLYCDWDRHWKQFHDTMAAVAHCGLPVVLSLHPLCKLETYQFAEVEYGVVISTNFRIHNLYPYCSVSVSFPCSTNLLALTFNKPLVIYDNFGILTRDEASRILNMIAGALVAQSGTEIAEHLRTFASIENSGDKVKHLLPENPRAASTIFEAIAMDLPDN